MKIRQYLTRKLTLEREGATEIKPLQIIKTGCSSGPDEHPVLISINDFDRERAGVEYLDGPVRITFLSGGVCEIEGLPGQDKIFREWMASSGSGAPNT